MLRNLDIGYDRVFTIGDRSMTDYEVTFPFVLHRIDEEGYNNISGTPAMGFTLGWTGRSAVGNETPFWGYWPSTGTASFVWDSVDEASLKVAGNDDAPQAFTPGVRLPLETPLRIRHAWSASTPGLASACGPGPTAARNPTDGPSPWSRTTGPRPVRLAVVAHHVDVSFGDIVVQEKR